MRLNEDYPGTISLCESGTFLVTVPFHDNQAAMDGCRAACMAAATRLHIMHDTDNTQHWTDDRQLDWNSS